MDKISFYGKSQPSEWKIGGTTYRMFFTMRATAQLEALLGKRYDEIVMEMLQVDPNSSGLAPAMTVERQAVIVQVLLEEGGTPCTKEQLLGMRMLDFSALARAAQAEMLLKQPHGD